jgi:Ca-activated chloride channel homolog
MRLASLLASHALGCMAFVCAVAVTIPGTSAQDNSDRPPWAQKPKPAAPTKTTSTTAPNGPPGQIVQPDPPDVPASNTQEAEGQRRIRVKVNLVTVLVSVLDEKNRPAPDLPREAFHLSEEGIPQKIEIFEPETSQPLDLALMIDSSMSTHKDFAFEQEAAAHFIRQVLRSGDRLSVFAFDDNVTEEAGFSENVAILQSAVRRIPSGAGTSIYDAVLLGSQALERRPDERRRVIILVTDGGETTSRTDFEHARREAVRSSALLYSIIIRPVKNESGRNTAGEHALETITDNTGGALFFPDTIQDLSTIFDRIDRELRTQYRLCYYPNPHGPANTYRNIEVTVEGNYHTRHRKTYLTGP